MNAEANGLKRPEEVLKADSCLAENALERADNEASMHRDGYTPDSSNHPNMRAALSSDREAKPL